MTAVLLIEDKHERHTLLRETLENAGMRVMSLSGTKKALSTIEASPPNLIVFDVPDHQPHLGSEFINELRQHDAFEHRIIIEGKEALLRPMEFRLLEFFMRNAEKVFSRRQLLDKVWGQSVFIEERTVDVHIRRLRNILDVHHKGELIQTVRGFGYRFSERV